MSTQPTTGSAWIPDDSSFAARLALIRWQKRWNQKEAALACGYPYSTWRKWEDGARPHDIVAAAAQIADRTGADEYWLLTGRRHNGSGPRPDVRDEGRGLVRHEGVEPPTRWLMPGPWSEGRNAEVLPFRRPGAEPGIAA